MLEASVYPWRKKLQDFLATDIFSILQQHPLPELHGKRLFITGATGFVGRWLLLAVKCLNEAGAGIRIVALSRDPERFLESAPEWRNTPWLAWIQGDIRDFTNPTEPIDTIIHGATDTSADFAARHPEDLYESMIRGTERVLQIAVQSKKPRVLLLSSGAVYGEQPEDMPCLTEDHEFNIEMDQNSYGQGKRKMEQLGQRFAAEQGLEIISARCFTFVGFGLAKHLAISQFIQDAQENSVIAVKGDGQTVRSYLYAADLAIWLLTLLARGKPQCAYNVGSPHAVTLLEAATRVREILAPGKAVITLNADTLSPRRRYVPDTQRAENELGLRAWTSLDEALQKTAHAGALST